MKTRKQLQALSVPRLCPREGVFRECNDIRGWVAGVTGLETVFFVSAGVQTAVIGTYAQQVVTRVVGYSWRLCPACAPARICGTGASFSLCFRVAWKIACRLFGAALCSGGARVLGRGQASNCSGRQIALAGLAGFLARFSSPVLFAPLAQTVLWIVH